MKKALAIALVVIMAASLIACAAPAAPATPAQSEAPAAAASAEKPAEAAPEAAPAAPATEEIGEHHFVLGTTTMDTNTGKTTGQYASKVFAEKLSELSGGKMTAETSWGGALGNTAQLFSQVGEGTIAMTICGLDVLGSLKNAGDTAVFAVPYLFDNYEHIHRYLNSDFFKEYWKGIEDANNVVMIADLGPNPCRNLNTKIPVRSLEDVKNLKIRVAESQASIAVWTAWGANPIVIAASEIYSALDNNLCDGWENQISAFHTLKTAEVAPYITRINYVYQGNVVLMNKDIYNGLNASEQAVLKEAFDYAYQHNYDQTFGFGEYEKPEEEYDIEVMMADPSFKGILIPDEEVNLEGFKAKAKEVWYELEGSLYSKGLIDIVRGMAEG